jgi:ankyrin repeat protein
MYVTHHSAAAAAIAAAEYPKNNGSTVPVEPQDSVLLSLVESCDWAATLARIASHPMETCVIGLAGRPPLHMACENDAPAVVIQSLLAVYPEASLHTGVSTLNPLHITCSSQHASVHVVRVLVEGGHSRQCTMRDEDGDTPLHTACRCGAPLEVLEILLKICPTVCYERDYEGLTPIQRLWVRYFVTLGTDVIDSVKGPADLHGELGDAWNKTELLLSAAHGGALSTTNNSNHGNGNGSTFRAVHAAAAVDCPRAVVKIAASVYPRQLDEKDENGMTPVMIAAQSPIFKDRDLSDDGYALDDVVYGQEEQVQGEHGIDGWPSDPSTENKGPQASVIEILLEANRESASAAACVPDPMGRLPLHWALATGKHLDQGVKPLIEVHPEALVVPDVETKLFPFMLAAQADNDMDTIYHVLRLNPATIGDLREGKKGNQ